MPLSDESNALDDDNYRIGFITPPFKDSKIPVTDHLHAHAYLLPADLMGWWRAVGFAALAWYAIDDLIAEIRYVSCSCPLAYKLPRYRSHVVFSSFSPRPSHAFRR